MPDQPPLNVGLLRYYADNIPSFDGNPKVLNRFVTACENFIRAFQNVQNPNDPINLAIFDTIVSKLRDRAGELIGSRTELTSWQQIKDALTLTFSDQRSIDCLIQDLINLKRFKTETPMQFGMRIQDARSLLFAKLNASIINAQEKQIKINHYEEFALKTFINGLPYFMQLPVRLKNPNSLEQALAFVVEEENFVYFNTGSNQNLKQQNYKPQPRSSQNYQNQNHHLKSSPPNFAHPTYTSFNRPQIAFRNSAYPPMFSSQPIFPIRPNFMPNQTNQFRPNMPFQPRPFQNFVSQKQNFFPPRPVQQQPFGNNRMSSMTRNNKLSKPEPMDTTSRTSTIKPKPKFTFEELYTQEVGNVQGTENIEFENPFESGPELLSENAAENNCFDDNSMYYTCYGNEIGNQASSSSTQYNDLSSAYQAFAEDPYHNHETYSTQNTDSNSQNFYQDFPEMHPK